MAAASRKCLDKPSIVEWFGDHEGYRCGYCDSKDTNYSHGMWAHSLSAEDYQNLLNRGWRRSGKYCYKPLMNQTCCPQYPIICDVENFTLNKSHKKVIKNMNRYLVHGDKSNDATWKCLASPSSSVEDTSEVKATGSTVLDRKTPRPGDGPDPDKPQCIKAKDRRLLKKLDKSKSDAKAGTSSSIVQLFKKKTSQEKTLEQLLDEPELSSTYKHKLEVRLVRTNPRSKDYTIFEDESFKIYRAYQLNVHHDKADDISERSYTQFLVDSPLQPQASKNPDLPGMGSYHTHYILDGKLIAVGVVDILPSSISSVYLFYDPDYSFLSLGTYTALREISYTRKLHLMNPELKYYNMGFYIHSCSKMRYKGQFRPSYLICPETYKWVRIEDCLPLLEENAYARLCKDKTIGDTDKNPPEKDILLLHNHEAMPLSFYLSSQPDESDVSDVRLYANLVGKKCSSNMLLYRS